MSATPTEVLGQWLQSLLDPDVVDSREDPDTTYVSLNTEDTEFSNIMPWVGKNVAVFGDLRYEWFSPGKVVSSPFSILAKVVKRQGDLPASPRGQPRHRSQLPQGRLLDHQGRTRRRDFPGLTLNITGSSGAGTGRAGGQDVT